MTTDPVDKKVFVIDILYQDGQFDSIQERLVKSKRPTRSVKREYDLMGKVVDSMGLINYKADTMYVLSTYYFTSCVSEIFNTSKGTFQSKIHPENTYLKMRMIILPICLKIQDIQNQRYTKLYLIGI